MRKRKLISLLLTASMAVSMLAACGSSSNNTAATTAAAAAADKPAETQAAQPAETEAPKEENLTGIDAIIKEAEGMTMEELAKKAIEESNGKTFYGVGNSSRR